MRETLRSEGQCIALGIAAQRYATAATADAGVRRLLLLLPFLPLNRVALFAAQITRESLDTRAPGGGIESRHHYYHHPLVTSDRSLSRHYEISRPSFLTLSRSRSFSNVLLLFDGACLSR